MLKFIFSCLLLALYLFSGVSKVFKFNETVDGLYTKPIFDKLPKIFSQLGIVGAIIILICCSLVVLYNDFYNKTPTIYKLSLVALILFTAFATILYHPPTEKDQIHHVMKNVSIIGGLGNLLTFSLKN